MRIMSVEERAEIRRRRFPANPDAPAARAARALEVFGGLLWAAVDEELARLRAVRESRYR